MWTLIVQILFEYRILYTNYNEWYLLPTKHRHKDVLNAMSDRQYWQILASKPSVRMGWSLGEPESQVIVRLVKYVALDMALTGVEPNSDAKPVVMVDHNYRTHRQLKRNSFQFNGTVFTIYFIWLFIHCLRWSCLSFRPAFAISIHFSPHSVISEERKDIFY